MHTVSHIRFSFCPYCSNGKQHDWQTKKLLGVLSEENVASLNEPASACTKPGMSKVKASSASSTRATSAPHKVARLGTHAGTCASSSKGKCARHGCQNVKGVDRWGKVESETSPTGVTTETPPGDVCFDCTDAWATCLQSEGELHVVCEKYCSE